MNNNNTDTKAFCTKYTGCFNSQENIKYISDIEFSSWVKKSYKAPSSFLKSIENAEFKDGEIFKLRNINSGLYMQVEGGAAENGTKLQQWATLDGTTHDLWKIKKADKGYYYLYSGVGDGNTFVLDVTGKNTANGTTLEINQFIGEDSQQFSIVDNNNGSYIIKSKITDNISCVEIKDGGLQSGDKVQQWEFSGLQWQKWEFEPRQLL